MPFDVPPFSVTSGRIHHAVDLHDIPGDVLRARELEHSRAEFVGHEIIVLKLTSPAVHAVALEEIFDNFRFTDIRRRDDFDIVAFEREAVEQSADLS